MMDGAWSVPAHTLAAVAIVVGLAALDLVRRGGGRAADAPPRLLAPALRSALVITAALGLAALTAPLAPPHALAALIGGAAAVQWGVQRVALVIYRRRMRQQLQLAVTMLAQQCSGPTALFPVFRATADALPWPLGDEWRWAAAQVNRPAEGGGNRRYVDHAGALRALAARTLLDAHAAVLDQMAAWYEHGQESMAGARLRRLAETLERRERAYRSAVAAMGRVRGEAWIISGAMALVALWLTLREPEMVISAFQAPWGGAAALWFLAWLLAPPAVAMLLVRRPDG